MVFFLFWGLVCVCSFFVVVCGFFVLQQKMMRSERLLPAHKKQILFKSHDPIHPPTKVPVFSADNVLADETGDVIGYVAGQMNYSPRSSTIPVEQVSSPTATRPNPDKAAFVAYCAFRQLMGCVAYPYGIEYDRNKACRPPEWFDCYYNPTHIGYGGYDPTTPSNAYADATVGYKEDLDYVNEKVANAPEGVDMRVDNASVFWIAVDQMLAPSFSTMNKKGAASDFVPALVKIIQTDYLENGYAEDTMYVGAASILSADDRFKTIFESLLAFTNTTLVSYQLRVWGQMPVGADLTVGFVDTVKEIWSKVFHRNDQKVDNTINDGGLLRNPTPASIFYLAVMQMISFNMVQRQLVRSEVLPRPDWLEAAIVSDRRFINWRRELYDDRTMVLVKNSDLYSQNIDFRPREAYWVSAYDCIHKAFDYFPDGTKTGQCIPNPVDPQYDKDRQALKQVLERGIAKEVKDPLQFILMFLYNPAMRAALVKKGKASQLRQAKLNRAIEGYNNFSIGKQLQILSSEPKPSEEHNPNDDIGDDIPQITVPQYMQSIIDLENNNNGSGNNLARAMIEGYGGSVGPGEPPQSPTPPPPPTMPQLQQLIGDDPPPSQPYDPPPPIPTGRDGSLVVTNDEFGLPSLSDPHPAAKSFTLSEGKANAISIVELRWHPHWRANYDPLDPRFGFAARPEGFPWKSSYEQDDFYKVPEGIMGLFSKKSDRLPIYDGDVQNLIDPPVGTDPPAPPTEKDPKGYGKVQQPPVLAGLYYKYDEYLYHPDDQLEYYQRMIAEVEATPSGKKMMPPPTWIDGYYLERLTVPPTDVDGKGVGFSIDKWPEKPKLANNYAKSGVVRQEELGERNYGADYMTKPYVVPAYAEQLDNVNNQYTFDGFGNDEYTRFWYNIHFIKKDGRPVYVAEKRKRKRKSKNFWKSILGGLKSVVKGIATGITEVDKFALGLVVNSAADITKSIVGDLKQGFAWANPFGKFSAKAQRILWGIVFIVIASIGIKVVMIKLKNGDYSRKSKKKKRSDNDEGDDEKDEKDEKNKKARKNAEKEREKEAKEKEKGGEEQYEDI